MKPERVPRTGDSLGYTPIGDYGLIGDCHGAALVSKTASIDWCCLHQFDADPVFCRLLDAERGGFWEIDADRAKYSRAYVYDTNILQTTIYTATGAAVVLDFMPVGRSRGAGIHDYVSLNAPGWVIRSVQSVAGSVALRIRYRPAGPGFGKGPVHLVTSAGVVEAEHGPILFADGDFTMRGGVAEAEWQLGEGEVRHMVLTPRWPRVDPRPSAPRLLSVTKAFWKEWLSYCRYQGPYRNRVARSALVLKLLTYAPTGALVAAPTTSLPEGIGGERNWDYRYCWLRDASLTLYALAALGYSGEAHRFAEFLQDLCLSSASPLQVMYGIDGRRELPERTLDHLAGYRDSKPVRIGNAAHSQSQIDVYGEVLDWALLRAELGKEPTAAERTAYKALADHVVTHWREPDHGLWEARRQPKSYIHGKIMAWVALDRALKLCGGSDEWRLAREEIIDAIKQYAMDQASGHLTRAFGESGLDAALLLLPMLGVRLDETILHKTVDAVQATLRAGDFVYRYKAEDGLSDQEGAFLVCSFWLVDALLALHRPEQAKDLFERLLGYANDVGLYPEEIDPATGEFLGNFPQAFAHLALINSAAVLDLYEKHGATAISGCHADRARRAIGKTDGLRGILHAARPSGRLLRLWSSTRSVLALD